MKKYTLTDQVGSLQPGTFVVLDKKVWHLVHTDAQGEDVLVPIEDESLVEALNETDALEGQAK